jgi:hypothetical protein
MRTSPAARILNEFICLYFSAISKLNVGPGQSYTCSATRPQAKQCMLAQLAHSLAGLNKDAEYSVRAVENADT